MLSDLSATQTAGDSYATISYALAGSPTVCILKDEPASAPLEFFVDDTGIEIVAQRYYRICDAKALSKNSENQVIWAFCTGAFQKKCAFT